MIMKLDGIKKSLHSVFDASINSVKKNILRQSVQDGLNQLYVGMLSNKKYIIGMKGASSSNLSNVKVVSSVKEIRGYIGLNEIDKNNITMLLCDDSYKLTIHDMPDIPDEDLQDAIRWQIDEELGITPEDSAIDAFKVPEQGRVKNSGYLITKPIKEVEEIQKNFEELDANVAVLSIAEIGLAKLVGYLYPNQEKAVCTIYISSVGQIHILITREGSLLFCRKLSLKDILLHPNSQNPLLDECKRSFSYIKNQRQVLITKILLLQKLPTEIQKQLVDGLGVDVEIIELADLRPNSHELGRSEYPLYLPLAGLASC
jgi:hypothetical protein